MNTRPKIRTSSEICADCSAPGPEWASINRGVLICDECCSVHRSLGRHISQVSHLRLTPWNKSMLSMVRTLVNNGANLIWEHSLSDIGQMKTVIRKPNPKDQVHPIKSNFIKAKYQMLAFVHRLPVSDDSLSASDLSKQLYSAVRTANLETTLRLISLGAQANYFHPEKGNTPLHAAAQLGQEGQVELLVVHGADPSALDSNGRTAAEIAKSEGYTDLSFRLLELMYDLTDRLTYYLCGRKPDHRNAINYLIPALADRGVASSGLAKEAKCKLQALSDRLFEELSSDVYDEVDRRENDAVWLATQHHRKIVSDHTAVPFLPVNPSFTSTRNQGRQKLARFNAIEFATLIVDLLHDARRRELASGPAETTGVVELRQDNDYDDPDHDYDEVNSDDNDEDDDDDDHSSPKHMSSPKRDSKGSSKPKKSPSKESRTDTSLDYDERKDSSSIAKERQSGSTDSSDQSPVSVENYNEIKRQLAKSEDRVQELEQLNSSMGQEVNLLRSMVQKLMQENAALRAQVAQSESRKDDLERKLNALENEFDRKCRVDETEDSDHVPVDRIAPHPSPGLKDSFDTEFKSKTSTPENNKIDHTLAGLVNPYDNINLSTGLYARPDKRRKSLETPNNHNHTEVVQNSPEFFESSSDSAAFGTEEDMPVEEGAPSQEDIVRATEQITKKIQELLLAAQGGRHSRYIPCSSNISSAVNDMASLFPKHPNSESVRGALRLMITSAARLQVECRSSVLPDRSIDTAMLTQQVIQCAYDIAKAAKHLVTTYNHEL